MTQKPDQQDHSTQENNDQEETLAQRSARLEAEAMAIADAKAHAQSDPLAPEPEGEDEEEIYSDNSPLDTGDAEADGHVVILRLQKELDETKDKMIRAVAEAENTRRRAQKEREDARKYSISGFAKELLTVSDNLRRALEAVQPELVEEHDQIKNLINGIEATERELLRAFEKNGITKLDTSEGVFNPNHHEVMFEAPGTGQAPGTIVQTLEPGYMLHDRLLRPARVGVAKDDGGGPPPETPHVDTQA